MKHTFIKDFGAKTDKPYMTLTCFEGCFKLKSDPRDLQMLYQIGIGLRTGQRFGMVEVE
jgi:CRISPR-associated endoribonuclease Cas6